MLWFESFLRLHGQIYYKHQEWGRKFCAPRLWKEFFWQTFIAIQVFKKHQFQVTKGKYWKRSGKQTRFQFVWSANDACYFYLPVLAGSEVSFPGRGNHSEISFAQFKSNNTFFYKKNEKKNIKLQSLGGKSQGCGVKDKMSDSKSDTDLSKFPIPTL